MPKQHNVTRVGIGVIIVNENKKILIGKRTGSHAPFYSIPGGHVELGETFEASAIREAKEETNLDIIDPQVIGITNNLETYRREGLHYVSIVLLAKSYTGTPKIMEPDKCEDLRWVDPHNLTKPHSDASQRSITCYLEGKFYKKNE